MSPDIWLAIGVALGLSGATLFGYAVGRTMGRQKALLAAHDALLRNEWDRLFEYREVRSAAQRALRRAEAYEGAPGNERTYLAGDFTVFETPGGIRTRGILRGPEWEQSVVDFGNTKIGEAKSRTEGT